MQIALHKNARTTPAVRAEIAASKETAAVLAQRYGIAEQNIILTKQLAAIEAIAAAAQRTAKSEG